MTKSTSTTAPTPIKRHLHRSTYVVAGLVLLLGVLMNCGGDYDQEYYVVTYGWPWSYGLYEPSDVPVTTWTGADGTLLLWSPWRIDLVEKFYGFSIVANLLAVVVLMMTAALLWEWRRRKVKRWYQFTIADWLMVSTGMALCYAGYERLYHDKQTCAQLRTNFLELNTPLFCTVDEGLESVDGIYYWAWDILRLPYEARPYKVNDLSIWVGDGRESSDLPKISIPNTFWNDLGNFPHLQTCSLVIELNEAKVQIPIDAFASLQRCPKLHQVQLHSTGDWFTDTHVFPLSKIRSLQSLSLQRNPSFRGDRLSHLNRLTNLSIENTGLNDNGLAELAQLEQVQDLKLAWNEEITSGGWAALENMKLKTLELDNTSLTRHAFATFKKMKALKSLDVFNARNKPRIAYPHNSNLHIQISDSGLTAEDEADFRAIVEPE